MKPNIQIYKYMIFDLNHVNEKTNRALEVGAIWDTPPFIEIDQEYDEKQTVKTCLNLLRLNDVTIEDEYFGPFIDWGLHLFD